MGVSSAPVRGQGASPACTANVGNRNPSLISHLACASLKNRARSLDYPHRHGSERATLSPRRRDIKGAGRRHFAREQRDEIFSTGEHTSAPWRAKRPNGGAE